MGAALAIFISCAISVLNAGGYFSPLSWHYFFFFAGRFLEVLALSLNAFAVGAPLEPGLRIRSPLPALILAFFLAIFLQSPGRFAMLLPLLFD